MIALLDIEKQKLILYKQEKSISFTQIESIYDYIDGDNNILYITNAIEVNADDILDIVRDMGIEIKKDTLQDNGVKYLHSINDGTIYIDETLKFKGKFDYKIIDHQMIEVIKTNQILQGLIKNNKIEIIGEKQKIKLIKEFQQFQNKQLDKQQLVDKQLDDIILKTKVSDWDGNITKDSHLDSIAIDIGGDNEKVETREDMSMEFDTISESLSNIEGTE